MVQNEIHTRRTFIGRLAVAALALCVDPRGVSAAVSPASSGHPEPRANVDADRVLSSDAVMEHVAELFDEIRAIPHIADGIGCHCGCGAMPDMRSLLSCYEGMGMAQYCVICEGEGRMAVSMTKAGKSLEEIRTAIDRRFG